MKKQVTSGTGLTLMSLSVAIAFALVAGSVAADQPSEDERQERADQGSGSSKDLGSYRVGAPGSSSSFRDIDRQDLADERPELDREGLGLDRSDFALEPAFGSSDGGQLEMDIRPSRESRSDRRVVDEQKSARERQRARSDVKEQDVTPVLIEAPRYPRQAFRSRTEGHVTVEFTVGTDGKTHSARVVESRPRSVFDANALRAVERWEFEPRIVDGRPVETVLTQTIDFNLDN